MVAFVDQSGDEEAVEIISKKNRKVFDGLYVYHFLLHTEPNVSHWM